MHFSSLLSVLAFVIKLKIASSAPNLDPNGETLLWNPVNLANFKESTNLLPSDSTSQLLGTKLNPDTPVLEPIENSVASSQPQYGDSSANLGTEKASPAVLPSQLLAKVELNCRKGMLAFCCFGVPYLDFFGNVNVPLCIGCNKPVSFFCLSPSQSLESNRGKDADQNLGS